MQIEDARPRLTTHSINFHHRCVRLSPDLVLVGLGGSVPGYQGDKEVWVGFPYTKEEDIHRDLTNLVPTSSVQESSDQSSNTPAQGSTKGDEIHEGDTLVLVTHVGPHEASTTSDQVDLTQEPVQSGSKSLRALILEPPNQKRILMNIHGHTHHSLGMTRLGKTFILNPGALRTGHFSILTLKKPYDTKWRIVGAEFHRV